MNYLEIYNQIIHRAKNRVISGYVEIHHIKPRCMGGSDTEDNLVKLSAKEHFVCHQLLVKIHPLNIKLIFAASAMARLRGDCRVGCREYSWLKEKLSEAKKTGQYIVCKCGKEKWKTPHQKKTGNYSIYCSKECSYKYRPPVKPRRGNVKSCQCCTKEFYCSPSVHQLFCSRACKVVGMTKEKKITNCICSNCNCSFTRPQARVKGKTNVFCNVECRTKYNSHILSNCLICNSTYSHFKYEKNRKYCSMKCYGQSKILPTI